MFCLSSTPVSRKTRGFWLLDTGDSATLYRKLGFLIRGTRSLYTGDAASVGTADRDGGQENYPSLTSPVGRWGERGSNLFTHRKQQGVHFYLHMCGKRCIFVRFLQNTPHTFAAYLQRADMDGKGDSLLRMLICAAYLHRADTDVNGDLLLLLSICAAYIHGADMDGKEPIRGENMRRRAYALTRIRRETYAIVNIR